MNMLTQFNQNQKTIEIDGAVIRQDQYGRFHLNDLHIASGGLDKNKPSNFLRQDQIQALVVEIERCSHMSNGVNAVESIRGGLNQGTYAVKQIVYAYAMWISPSFNLKVINTFDAVVTQKPAELSRMDLIQLALAAEQENIALKQHVAVLAPKAEALDTIAETTGTYSIRECVKAIGGIREKDLIQLLLDKKWCYRDAAKKLQPCAQFVINGVFLNRTSPAITNAYDGQERVFLHMRVTAFGLTRIAGLVNKMRMVAA